MGDEPMGEKTMAENNENGNVNLADVVALKTFCETHGIDHKRARRMARNGEFDGAFIFAKRWVIARDANVPAMSDARTHRTRDDGRQRFVVYMTVDECATVANVVGPDNVVDVRAVARERRELRKLAGELADNPKTLGELDNGIMDELKLEFDDNA